MKYMLMFRSPSSDLEREPGDPASHAYWESWRLYMDAIHASGVVKSGNALVGPVAATTVRTSAGKRHIHDGPFADTKEILGGYLVIEVASLDEAIAWASRSPSSQNEGCSTEVRPVLEL